MSVQERFHHLGSQGLELSIARERSFRVSLIRRLLTDQPHFVGIAKQFLDVTDFYQLLRRVIHPAGSHGKLGGKGSGLLLASKVLRKLGANVEALAGVRTPKTWYLTSDGILKFINSNDLEEIVKTKYEDLGQIRQEYPRLGNEEIKPLLDKYCEKNGLKTIAESTIGKVIKHYKFFYQKAGRVYHDPSRKQADKQKRLRVKRSPRHEDFGHIIADTVERVTDGVKDYFYKAFYAWQTRPGSATIPSQPRASRSGKGTARSTRPAPWKPG